MAMAAQGIVSKDGDDTVLTSLDPTIPSTNIGLPIIIVPAKVIQTACLYRRRSRLQCDASSHLEKMLDFRSEHFDYIQLSIRYGCLRMCDAIDPLSKFALSHGAAIVYTGKVGLIVWCYVN